MNSHMNQWAVRWNVPYRALQELDGIFGLVQPNAFAQIEDGVSEAYVQSRVRLEAARKGLNLWRNNVGALLNPRGVPVRYGLGNDSPTLNKVLKSGDLIGWRPVLIGPEHVGIKIAQFVSRECKPPGWTYKATEREIAQLKWAEAVNADGGDACFVTGEGTL